MLKLWRGAWGDQEAENRASDPATPTAPSRPWYPTPQMPTDPSQRGVGRRAAPLWSRRPHLLSLSGQPRQVTPCSLHCPAQAGTMQDSLAHQTHLAVTWPGHRCLLHHRRPAQTPSA